MNFWKLLIPMIIAGCINENADNKANTENVENANEVSVYDNAFMIMLPPEVKDSKVPRKIFGDEVQYWGIFNNNDSSIIVDVEISRDTSRSFDGLMSAVIDGLKHFEPNMLVLNKEKRNQHGTEMLSIVYELPLVQSVHGYIVERSIFFTAKGRATVDVKCRFGDPKQKGNCIKLAKTITESIKINQ